MGVWREEEADAYPYRALPDVSGSERVLAGEEEVSELLALLREIKECLAALADRTGVLTDKIDVLEKNAEHPMRVINTECPSRRDLLALEIWKECKSSKYIGGASIGWDEAYEHAELTIKASGEKSDG